MHFHLAETIFGNSEHVQYLVGWLETLYVDMMACHSLSEVPCLQLKSKVLYHKEKILDVCMCIHMHLCIYFQTENKRSLSLLNLCPLSFLAGFSFGSAVPFVFMRCFFLG